MKIYARVTPSNPVAVSSLSAAIHDIGDLYLDGYLTPDATVWVNADFPDIGMWVLTDRSTHIRRYTTPKPGWVRIDNSQCRFAPTCDGTRHEPVATFTLGDIPFVGDPSSTIVVSHTDPKARVRVVAGSRIAHYTGGEFRFGPYTVVDLINYTRPEKATTSTLAAAQAMVNGSALMGYGLDTLTQQFIGDNIDSFSFELTDNDFGFLDQMRSHYTRYATEKARKLRDTITDVFTKNGMSIELGTVTDEELCETQDGEV